jgi:PadR family transcriptional regulator, regulatory protein PadR
MDAIEKLKKSTTTDNVWMYVLSVLKKEDMHAYALHKEIEKKFKWAPELITSYVVLYRIEKEKLIESKKDGRKKIYTITPKGSKTLKEAKKHLREIAEVI